MSTTHANGPSAGSGTITTYGDVLQARVDFMRDFADRQLRAGRHYTHSATPRLIDGHLAPQASLPADTLLFSGDEPRGSGELVHPVLGLAVLTITSSFKGKLKTLAISEGGKKVDVVPVSALGQAHRGSDEALYSVTLSIPDESWLDMIESALDDPRNSTVLDQTVVLRSDIDLPKVHSHINAAYLFETLDGYEGAAVPVRHTLEAGDTWQGLTNESGNVTSTIKMSIALAPPAAQNPPPRA